MPEFLRAADAIGSRLCRDAVWWGERCTWLGDSMEFIDNRWQVAQRAFGGDLYAGTAGIGLFLAHLAALTRERVHRETAEGALRHALAGVEALPTSGWCSLYAGIGGAAYAATQAGAILNRDWLTTAGLHLADRMLSVGLDSQGIDVLSGSAGAIALLLRLARRFSRPALGDAAERHGRRLLALADRQDDVWRWDTGGSPDSVPLTGFSHGAAGIGWALLELFAATGEPSFREAAHGAFAYERACFSPEHGNWPDFRSTESGGGPSYMTAWCHGAPGIALSRLRAFEIIGELEAGDEARAALATVKASVSASTIAAGSNFSLCHGCAGNAEPLIVAARVLGDQGWFAAAVAVGEQALGIYESRRMPWPCGVVGGGEAPGLLLGLAGIGYFLLRLHDPATPSILLLEVH